jgi:hypothetical protein
MTAIFANLGIDEQTIAVTDEVIAAINAAIASSPIVTGKWVNDVRVYTPDPSKHLVLVPTIIVQKVIKGN